jgi:hypothetical protein
MKTRDVRHIDKADGAEQPGCVFFSDSIAGIPAHRALRPVHFFGVAHPMEKKYRFTHSNAAVLTRIRSRNWSNSLGEREEESEEGEVMLSPDVIGQPF